MGTLDELPIHGTHQHLSVWQPKTTFSADVRLSFFVVHPDSRSSGCCPGLLSAWLIDQPCFCKGFTGMLLNTFRSLAGQGPAGAAVALTWLGALRSHSSESRRSAGRFSCVWEKVCTMRRGSRY
jgi:hypothetical protein